MPDTITLRTLGLRIIEIPMKAQFESAIGTRKVRRALFVRWEDEEGRWGIGESSCRPDPYFNEEYVDGSEDLIKRFIFPMLPAKGGLQEVSDVLERIRGWPFTKASILDSVQDMIRRCGGEDALDAWAPPADGVPIGISLPLFKTESEGLEAVQQAIDAGYPRVKLKVMPEMNTDVLSAIRLAFPSLYLGLDANGSCRDADTPFFEKLASCRPNVLEQPFPPERLDWCQAFRTAFPDIRVCLDESIRSLGDCITAWQMQALDEVNVKPGRVGGMPTAIEIAAFAQEKGFPAWVGGMFETGIGRSACLRLAARLPNATAHDLRAPDGYLDHDFLETSLAMNQDGMILHEDAPVEPDWPTIERYTVHYEELKR